MIKTIKIKNFYGIEDLFLSFKLKNITQSMGQEEQVARFGNDAIALIPTFIARNASGKSSVLKTIDFALKFSTKEFFKFELLNMVLSILRKIKLSGDLYVETTENDYNQHHYGEDMIAKLFRKTSYAGSTLSQVELEMTDNTKIEITLTKESFSIKINDSIIDVLNLIEKIQDQNKIAGMNTARWIKTSIDKILDIKNYKFYNGLYSFIYPGIEEKLLVPSILFGNNMNSCVSKIINHLGFETFKLLLKKIDKNIKRVSHDNEAGSWEIYVNSVSDVPLSPSNLSSGTKKILRIIGDSLNLFKNGGVMLIDEIENGLHASLVKFIIKLYEEPEINIKKAQLIITTHNPSIMEEGFITPHNVYLFYKNKIRSLKDDPAFSRTEDAVSMLKVKNYLNDMYWVRRGSDSKSTVSNLDINVLIDSISESKKWVKK